MTYKTADIGTALVVIAWALLTASTLIVALRFWVRSTRIHKLGFNDWCMLVSLLCEYVHTILICVAYTYGLGRHISTLSDNDRSHAIKYIIIIQFFAIVTSMFGRISFASFFLGIVGSTRRIQKAMLWAVILVQLVVTVPTLIQIYTQCGSHLSALWDSAVAVHTYCESPNIQTTIGYVQSGLNSLCDLVLTIVPCLILWQLHLPASTKAGLGAVLTLSIFAFAASLVKAVEIKSLGARSDYTRAFVNLTICVCIENNIVILAASIPTLRPIMRQHGTTSTDSNTGKGCSGGLHGGICSPPDSGAYEKFAKSSRFGKRPSDSTWLNRGSLGSRFDVQPTTVEGHSATADHDAFAVSEDQCSGITLQTMSSHYIKKTTQTSIEYEDNDLEAAWDRIERSNVRMSNCSSP